MSQTRANACTMSRCSKIRNAADRKEHSRKEVCAMSQFTSWDDYKKFARDIRECRYIHTPSVRRFLEAVSQTAKRRVHLMEEEWDFWRAQGGYRGKRVRRPHPDNRMKPLPGRAFEGRVNPKGVPCLYGAKSPETAIAEIRPWKGEIVSVAVFKVRSNLKIVDCCTEHDGIGVSSLLNTNRLTKPAMKDIESDIWNHIDRAFSEPISRTDDQADYVPRQVIAEVFKRDGYDGIGYRSRLSENGVNVALLIQRSPRLLIGGYFMW
jgi:hypothetical protein